MSKTVKIKISNDRQLIMKNHPNNAKVILQYYYNYKQISEVITPDS